MERSDLKLKTGAAFFLDFFIIIYIYTRIINSQETNITFLESKPLVDLPVPICLGWSGQQWILLFRQACHCWGRSRLLPEDFWNHVCGFCAAVVCLEAAALRSLNLGLPLPRP